MAQAHGAEVMGHHDENADVQTPSSGPSPIDAYQKEMSELKTLMQKTLEQKGVLAKIKVNLRAASVLPSGSSISRDFMAGHFNSRQDTSWRIACRPCRNVP